MDGVAVCRLLSVMNGLYVQYGCGWNAPESWVNFDCSPTLRFERLPIIGRLYTRNIQRFPQNVRYGDIIKGLPLQPVSCDGIYCSHVLEHLALVDFRTALRNTFAYLKPEGIFRLVVPDLEQLVHEYINDTAAAAAIHFMEASYLGRKTRSRTIAGILRDWWGNSAHLWMWDEKSMRQELNICGFVQIRRAGLNDSEDPRFKDVEDSGRFEGCLAMQCRKPSRV